MIQATLQGNWLLWGDRAHNVDRLRHIAVVPAATSPGGRPAEVRRIADPNQQGGFTEDERGWVDEDVTETWALEAVDDQGVRHVVSAEYPSKDQALAGLVALCTSGWAAVGAQA